MALPGGPSAVRGVITRGPGFSDAFEEAFVGITSSMLNAADARLREEDRDFVVAEGALACTRARMRRGERERQRGGGGGRRQERGRRGRRDRRDRSSSSLSTSSRKDYAHRNRQQRERQTSLVVRHALVEVCSEILFDPGIVTTVRRACRQRLEEWQEAEAREEEEVVR